MKATSGRIEACKRADALAGRLLAALRGGRRPRPWPTHVRHALVVRLWGLGNLALLAPLLASAGPSRRLRLLTLERNADFVRAHFPAVELLAVPDPTRSAFAPAVIAAAVRLHRDPPQVVADMETLLTLPLVLVRAACAAPVAGLDTPGQPRAAFLDRPVPWDPTRHAALSFLAVARAAGLEAAAGPGALRPLPAAVEELARRLPRTPRPLVVLHPGSGDHVPGRRWPAERFGQLARTLGRRTRVVLTGTREEAGLVATVAHTAGRDAVVDLAGRLSAAELVALLDRSALLVTNDTGPLHVADALGTPVVALFGPNTPLRHGPRRPGSAALYADLPCSPCLDDRNGRRSGCTHFSCLREIAVADVLAACERCLRPVPEGEPHALVR